VSSDMASERSSAAVSERYPGDSEPRTDYALLPRAPAGGEHPLARTAPPPAAPPGTPLRPGMAYLHDAFEATSGNSPAARPRKVAAAAPLPSHLLFDLSRTQARLCPPAIDADAPRQRPLPPPPPPPIIPSTLRLAQVPSVQPRRRARLPVRNGREGGAQSAVPWTKPQRAPVVLGAAPRLAATRAGAAVPLPRPATTQNSRW
jgi:hypothetical protein